jgi:protease-4
MLSFFGILLIRLFLVVSLRCSGKNNSVIELNFKDYAGNLLTHLTMFSENKNVGLIDIINAIENAKQMMISKEFLF